MPSNAQAVATRFPPRDLAAIDALIKAGHYANRADFLRQAAREKLAQARRTAEQPLELEPLPPAIQKIQDEIGREGPIWTSREDMLADLRKVRHEIYKEEFGEDP